MPRYMVERTFRGGLEIPLNDEGDALVQKVIGNNASHGVTWVNSFVSEDRMKTFCIYDAPNPEAIRQTAEQNQLPVDRITEVKVLDPDFYR